jgi:hypothetical protein
VRRMTYPPPDCEVTLGDESEMWLRMGRSLPNAASGDPHLVRTYGVDPCGSTRVEVPCTLKRVLEVMAGRLRR